MNKLNRILVILLVVQLIIAAIVLLPRTLDSGAGEVGPLFPDLETGRIVGLTITGPEGQTVQLAKSGADWVLADASGYPVLEDVVPDLLEKIVALQTNRLVTETSGSHKRLKVAGDEFERLVEVELDDGERLRFYIGSSPSFRAAHIRAADQDEVYLTSEFSAQDVGLDATSWVDRTYLSVPRDDVLALTLVNENGTFEFAKEGETWTWSGLPAGETLNETAIQTLLSRATSVSLLRPLGREEKAEYGLGTPSAVVILQTHSDEGGDKTYTLSVGAQDPEDSSYVVVSSESPYYVRVNEFAVQDFIEKTGDDFLQQPTPAPEVTPGG